MPDFKVVFHNGFGLLVSQLVLDQMGLKPSQNITEAQAWEAMILNTAGLVADVDLRRLAGEEGMPDTTELKEGLERLRSR